jgi:hypothetical protein
MTYVINVQLVKRSLIIRIARHFEFMQAFHSRPY